MGASRGHLCDSVIFLFKIRIRSVERGICATAAQAVVALRYVNTELQFVSGHLPVLLVARSPVAYLAC